MGLIWGILCSSLDIKQWSLKLNGYQKYKYKRYSKMQKVTHLQAIETTESKLIHLQKLKTKIKTLEAEFEMVKKEVINEYFVNQGEYRTSKGLLLATYIEIKSNRFDSTAFSKAHPKMYENFKKESTSYRFDLK